MHSISVACCLVVAALAARGSALEQVSVPGITFAIDTVRVTQDVHPDPGGNREMAAFASYTGRVIFAAGRGRLDVNTRRSGPVVLVDGIAPTTPLAMPGDYYLFDSTGFLLVRPQSRSFSSFSISDDSYNYQGRRDGWPDFFMFQPARFDTVAAGPPSDSAHHGPIHIYWHTDAFATKAIARGRLTLDDAPIGEMNVAQWFGAARAIARLADSTHAFPKENVTVTAAIPQRASGGERVPVSFILKEDLVHLEAVNVETARLVLPEGFAQAPWPGQAGVANPGPGSDNGARWRKLPEPRRPTPPM